MELVNADEINESISASRYDLGPFTTEKESISVTESQRLLQGVSLDEPSSKDDPESSLDFSYFKALKDEFEQEESK